EPHEDPETAKAVFSGISLLNYYSGSLDFVLQKDPAEVETRLKKMPYTYIPQSLEEATDDFATSSIRISHLVVEIDDDLGKLRALTERFLSGKAMEESARISDNLSQANTELKLIERAVETIGEELKVSSSPAQSDLRSSYDEVMERIDRMNEMLALYQELLELTGIPMEKLLELTGITIEELLEGTDISIEELLKSTGISAEELLESTGITIEELLELTGIPVEEFLELTGIPIEELVDLTGITVEELLESTGITVEEFLELTGIPIEELLGLMGITIEEFLELMGITIEELLELTGITIEELLDAAGITIEDILEPTDISLEVQFAVVFVGDNIRFEGKLTSERGPLARREVDILVSGSRYVTVRTDAYGHYQGVLQVPYWYIPQLDVQALYYPRGKDIGVYLASLSPVIKMKVLFYEAGLEVTVKDKAYPGLETTMTGRFDYGQSPPPSERKVEIYLDDVLISEVIAQEAFAQEIEIDREADVGEHVITVSSAAAGRYASVDASIVLNVTKATPIFDISIPKVTMIPGSVGLGGKLYSEVGPLSGAVIKMGLGKSQVELVSSEDGTFDTEIDVGMGFGVIGWQELVTRVLPQETWHTSLNTTSRILMVNIVGCGVFFAVVLFLAIYLPGRLRRRLEASPKRPARPVIVTAPPEPAPTYGQSVTVLTLTEEREEGSKEPRARIFHGYHLVIGLMQGISRAFLKSKPQQTLREFANEASGIFGPAARHFVELTRIVERLIYSRYSPVDEDAERASELSRRVWEESEPKVTTQPLFASQLRREGTVAQFESNDLSVVGEARTFEFGGGVLKTGSWRQLSTWLWVLLILAAAYYACILLFLLPLLVASLAVCLPLVIVDNSSKRGTKAMTKEESKDESV
ncbi:DUF4129 domain-containing protein, partial [Chloroflexota bacterium]